MTNTIDLAPTWCDMLPAMIAVLRNQDASFDSVEAITCEMTRMAKILDNMNNNEGKCCVCGESEDVMQDERNNYYCHAHTPIEWKEGEIPH
jgi:hypothetical protein